MCLQGLTADEKPAAQIKTDKKETKDFCKLDGEQDVLPVGLDRAGKPEEGLRGFDQGGAHAVRQRSLLGPAQVS